MAISGAEALKTKSLEYLVMSETKEMFKKDEDVPKNLGAH